MKWVDVKVWSTNSMCHVLPDGLVLNKITLLPQAQTDKLCELSKCWLRMNMSLTFDNGELYHMVEDVLKAVEGKVKVHVRE